MDVDEWRREEEDEGDICPLSVPCIRSLLLLYLLPLLSIANLYASVAVEKYCSKSIVPLLMADDVAEDDKAMDGGNEMLEGSG